MDTTVKLKGTLAPIYIAKPKERKTSPKRRILARQRDVQPISQIFVTILSNDEEATFISIRNEIISWMEKKAGHNLPASALSGDSFDLRDVGAQHSAAVNLPDYNLWMGRQDDSDSSVASRTWVTEFGLFKTGTGSIQFGCRLQCVSVGRGMPIRTVPKFVKDILTKHPALLDGRPISTQAWVVDDAEKVEDLAAFLVNPSRKRDVFIVSTSEKDDARNACLFDPDTLAWRVAGAAHVVMITNQAGKALAGKIGKDFAIFNQAVRTFRAKFDPEQDQPTLHPIAFKERITNWERDSEGNIGIPSFVGWLAGKALESTVRGRNLESELPSFTDAVTKEASIKYSQADEAGASDEELLELALNENKSLFEAKALSDQLLTEASNENKDLLQKLQLTEAEIEAEHQRNRQLSTAIERMRKPTGGAQSLYPDELDSLEDWSARNLAGTVYLHHKAIKEARKCNFEKPKLVYQTLIVLRDHLVPIRRGEVSGKEYIDNYNLELNKLGLHESASLSNGSYEEMGDTYKTLFEGRKLVLDRHLKGSDSRDERFGFRLYFSWDEETQQIVVGWLPTHLPNRLT